MPPIKNETNNLGDVHLNTTTYDAPDISILREKVIGTLDGLEISSDMRNHILVVGSAALVLHGIVPPSVPGEKSRPHDVDLLISGSLHDALRSGAFTPYGKKAERGIVRKRTNEWQVPPTLSLTGIGVDFIYKPDAAPRWLYDRKIMRPDNALHTPEGYRAVSLRAARKQLMKIVGGGGIIPSAIVDKQAAMDIGAINVHRYR